MVRFKQVTENFGFKYGPNFSLIKQIWHGNNEGLCLLDISESPDIQSDRGSFVIHPSILDACLQSCFVPLGSSSVEDKSIVPVGFKSITLNRVPTTSQMYCHVTADVNEFGRFDVRLLSPSGKVLLSMFEFRIAELTSSPRQLAFADLAYEVKWKEGNLERQQENAQNMICIVLKDSSNFSDSLVTKLEKENANVITIDPPSDRFYNNETRESIQAAFSNIVPSNSSSLKVVNMWPIETTFLPDRFEVINQAEQLAFSSCVFLLQLLLEKGGSDPRLFFVTESTQTLDSCNKSSEATSIPWGSTVWGLRRTANLEEFNVRVTAVDLCSKKNMSDVDLLVSEIVCDSKEDEVAFRDGKRFINRLIRANVHDKKTVNDSKSEQRNSFCISTMPLSGKICLRDQSVSKPSQSELTLEVLHCWIPSENLSDITKPKDCVFVVGKVTHLPEENKHSFKVGDEVCGVIPSGRVSRSICIQASNVFPKPIMMTTEQATFLSPCLAIALKALQAVGPDKENQKVLIQEADRIMGLAAVVLAKALGFKVFCTVSDTCEVSTRTILLELGVDFVMAQSSQSLNDDSNEPFDEVVFLYPPPPNALQKSIQSIKSGGKVTILSSSFHGDIVFHGNVNVKYERDDIADVFLTPSVYERLSSESMKILNSKGTIEKLQEMEITSLDLSASIKVSNASIPQQNCRPQIKSVAAMPIVIYSFGLFDENSLQGIPILSRGLDGCGLKGNRTYLIAGGMRGFGFEVASWMAENGAKSIGLIGRSKPSNAKLLEIRQLERKTGAKIHTFRVSYQPSSCNRRSLYANKFALSLKFLR